MIHLERVALPQGLRAVAYRDKRGNLIIYVSETLDAARQRAAVVEAIRASRRTEWRHGGLPSAGIVLLLGIRMALRQAAGVLKTALRQAAGAPKTALRRAAGAVKARPVAWGAAATTAVAGASAAGVFITAAPHHPALASRQPEPSAAQPLTPQRQPPGHSGHQVPARAAPAPAASAGRGQAAAAERGRPAPTSSGGSSPTPAPAPSASPSPTPSQPTPAPSPSPSGGICVAVLGIRVCVR
jgi:hypothetical protein